MKTFKRYLLVHLAKSLAIALPVALLGFGTSFTDITDFNAAWSTIAPGVVVFTGYWASRFKTIKKALDNIKAPSADDVVDDLFDVDDVGS